MREPRCACGEDAVICTEGRWLCGECWDAEMIASLGDTLEEANDHGRLPTPRPIRP